MAGPGARACAASEDFAATQPQVYEAEVDPHLTQVKRRSAYATHEVDLRTCSHGWAGAMAACALRGYDSRRMLELLLDAEVYAPQSLGRRNLLVGGGRVLWIGEDEPEMPEELGVVVTDLDGKRLIPGLVDSHAHLTGGGGEAGYASRVPPMMLSHFTLGGVTSVVGLLGTDDLTRTTAQLVATARGLIEEGLSAWCYTGGYHVPPAT